MIHGKADEGFQQLFVCEINGEFFGARFEQRTKRLQVFFGQEDGDDFKTAFEQAADDLFAFGHEDALPFMLQRPAHRAIRREFGQVERGDFLDVEHVGRAGSPLPVARSNVNRGAHGMTRGFWNAVAERSGDTALWRC